LWRQQRESWSAVWDSLGTLALEGGPWGLIGLFVLSILRGWLIPRSVHESRVADLRQRGEDFKAAWEAERNISTERQQQIAILLGRGKENA
jgi:hypothetical protein